MKIIFVSVAIILVGVINGCTKDDQGSMMNSSTAPQVTVTPGDGATSIRLDAPITLTFAKPVDQTISERNVHLFSGKDMSDSVCPMGMMTGQDMMGSSMMDSSMMIHLISQHGTHGRFQWNTNGTRCSFFPDSMMIPNMTYMIHIGREMVQMMETRIGQMGMMGGHGSGMMSTDMIYHFRTMDTTNTGSGHDGHH